jgi:uncharacterized SAM-binding protein YcdF (DUF218 family)
MTATMLAELGVDRARLTLEAGSRNTDENASRTAALLRAAVKDLPVRCYLLVTSAYHMPRAKAAFAAAGVPVLAAPTDWRSDDARPMLLTSFIGNLEALDLAAHEYLGLLAQKPSPHADGRTCALH